MTSPCHEDGAQLYSDGSCICIGRCCNAVTGECTCPDENRAACNCNHTVTAVTVPVDGTFLTVDGVVRRVQVELHAGPDDDVEEWWQVVAEEGS